MLHMTHHTEDGADQRSRKNYSLRAWAGELPVECFIAAHTFFEGSQTQPSFSEDHVHACFELLICHRGSGFQFVDGKGHPYEDNSIFVLSPFVTHAHVANGAAPEVRYSVRFILPDGQELSGNYDPGVESALGQLRQNGYFQFMADPFTQGIVAQLAQTVLEAPPLSSLMMSGQLSALFSYVFRQISLSLGEGKDSWRTLDGTGGDSARRFIIDDFFDRLMDGNARMEELCEMVHLSQSQLNRVIRELYGTTFKQRLIDVRIAYIQYFLRYSKLSVREIAEKTGFAEDGKLSQFFRRYCGVSPTQYRARFQPPER